LGCFRLTSRRPLTRGNRQLQVDFTFDGLAAETLNLAVRVAGIVILGVKLHPGSHQAGQK
jgi:hypothetical protein